MFQDQLLKGTNGFFKQINWQLLLLLQPTVILPFRLLRHLINIRHGLTRSDYRSAHRARCRSRHPFHKHGFNRGEAFDAGEGQAGGIVSVVAVGGMVGHFGLEPVCAVQHVVAPEHGGGLAAAIQRAGDNNGALFPIQPFDGK